MIPDNEMHARVSAEVQRVLDDMSDGGTSVKSINASVEDGEVASLAGLISELPNDRYVVRFTIEGGTNRECQLFGDQSHYVWRYLLAEVAQDIVDTETREPRPLCPRHLHPMVPKMIDKESFWVCPQDGSTRCEIGDYRRWIISKRTELG